MEKKVETFMTVDEIRNIILDETSLICIKLYNDDEEIEFVDSISPFYLKEINKREFSELIEGGAVLEHQGLSGNRYVLTFNEINGEYLKDKIDQTINKMKLFVKINNEDIYLPVLEREFDPIKLINHSKITLSYNLDLGYYSSYKADILEG